MMIRKSKRISIAAIVLVIVMIVSTACSAADNPSSDGTAITSQNTETDSKNGPKGMHGPGGKGGMKPGGGGGMDKSEDKELQSMVSEVKSKFTTGEYSDADSGLSVPYNIFLPEDYDESKTYPMVVFIGDATTVGTDMEYSLTQGWGGTVWATSEEQAKHEAIVLVPVFPETVIDDNNGENKSGYLELIPNMITDLAGKYHADTSRIYGTGQSMGAMATLYTAANNPDLYAGILIVDGQWNTEELQGIETQNMVYITAGGDEKASQGQEDVKKLLDSLGTKYSQASGWDAQADEKELNASCEQLFSESNAINFITWEAGTVLNGGNGSEHMASFDYAYKLEKVRDWLFEQHK